MEIQQLNFNITVDERANLDHALHQLRANKAVWPRLPLSNKIDLLQTAMQNLQQQAAHWVALVNSAKRFGPDSPWAGDEWYEVYVVARGICGYMDTLQKLAGGKRPFPTHLRTRSDGQVIARVFPNDIYDWLLFNGMSVDVWMQPGVTQENLAENMAGVYRRDDHTGKVALVLGAGNVTSIAPLDALYRLFGCNQVVLLKLSPVNAYLRPLWDVIFAPFIAAGFMAIVGGDTNVGSYLTRHAGVDEIHITGSINTYNNIVNAQGGRLQKLVTAELGGVTPVIVVPGQWRAADIRFQAENVVSMKLYNNGFNCIAAQILLLPERWNQREAFINAVRQVMQTIPPQTVTYPGMQQRREAVLQAYPNAELLGDDRSRILITDIHPQFPDAFGFCDEFFGPVLAVVTLPGESPEVFLRNAVQFCNEKLYGTLGVDMLIHPKTKRQLGSGLETAVSQLRYGAIGVNVWCAIAYRITQAPWGAYQDPNVGDIGSGFGVVHNTLLFDKPQKAVVGGSFYPFPRTLLHGDPAFLPKPPWFLTNKTRTETARHVGKFTLQPDIRRIPGLFMSALRG